MTLGWWEQVPVVAIGTIVVMGITARSAMIRVWRRQEKKNTGSYSTGGLS